MRDNLNTVSIHPCITPAVPKASQRPSRALVGDVVLGRDELMSLSVWDIRAKLGL